MANLISIITINLNNKAGLLKTINSIFSQQFLDYELIIIDGHSTDGSKELIEQNQSRIAYWVSEKDAGVYDAMNKGIGQAKGKYLFFLNSGDCFTDANVLKGIADCMSTGDYDFVYGNVIYNNRPIKYKDELSLYYILNMGMCHQTQFLKKLLFEKYGYYDTAYKVTADHCKLILFLAKYNATYKHANIDVAIIEPGGMSTVSIDSNRQERHLFMQKEFPLLTDDYILLRRYKKLNIFERAKNLIIRKFSAK
ncbi:glycosyltransferase family 2 protein [Ferruginibacter sp. SUN002]|uniref:glycosyltransferase family 2 protein n=1 Tax=Ferruginibacter sp. SUN002 TaxID=2937789 RepID=UPI003D3655A8